MLPAKSDRTNSQRDLVSKFYAEYAALNCDIYELDAMQKSICSNQAMPDIEAEARLAALYALEAETYDFNPALGE
jgi:hypothetical protein